MDKNKVKRILISALLSSDLTVEELDDIGNCFIEDDDNLTEEIGVIIADIITNMGNINGDNI